jgi:heme exporter protein D
MAFFHPLEEASMDHQDFAELLGNYGAFVGAIAVVVTLVYLAMQIRHSVNTSQALSRQTLIDGWSGSQANLQSDPELLRIYAKGIMRWETMSNAEKTRFDIGMAQFLSNVQNGILLRQAGMLDQVTLDAIAEFMLTCIRCQGGAKWWQDTGFAMPETRAYLEGKLRETRNGVTAAELAPHWMALAEEQ